jgi:hypothetical protein
MWPFFTVADVYTKTTLTNDTNVSKNSEKKQHNRATR